MALRCTREEVEVVAAHVLHIAMLRASAQPSGKTLHGIDIGMGGAGAEIFLAHVVCHALTKWCHKTKKFDGE
jgi:hypothetical protein